MKHAIFSVPATTSLDTLTPEQRAAILSVDSQFVLPMPGTVVHEGQALVDGLTSDAFDPTVMPSLGLDWTCLYLAQWDGQSETATDIVPLDIAALAPFLAPIVTYDDEGNVLGSEPAPLSLPHHWAGWPEGVE